ncbi:hypothetical protein ABK040_010776 [Willaertia magna]
MSSNTNKEQLLIQEVIARAGLVYSEKSTLGEILSKPKIIPLKSITLQKIEEMEKEALEKGFKLQQQEHNDPFNPNNNYH